MQFWRIVNWTQKVPKILPISKEAIFLKIRLRDSGWYWLMIDWLVAGSVCSILKSGWNFLSPPKSKKLTILSKKNTSPPPKKKSIFFGGGGARHLRALLLDEINKKPVKKLIFFIGFSSKQQQNSKNWQNSKQKKIKSSLSCLESHINCFNRLQN